MPSVAEDGDQELAENVQRKAEELRGLVHLPACQVSRTGAATPSQGTLGQRMPGAFPGCGTLQAFVILLGRRKRNEGGREGRN